MEMKNFIENFSSLFDETAADVFTPELKFKDLKEYSSLIALSIIAMVDDEYGVTLKGNDISNSNTIQDLFDTIKDKI